MSHDWMEWNGGKCPVDGDTMVDVRFRGLPEPGIYVPAKDLLWEHRGKDTDIARYRVVTKVEGPTDGAKQETELSKDFASALSDPGHPYHTLANTLLDAYTQAAFGKGKERHAIGETPFDVQPMANINRQLGSVHGFIYQAHKKSLEAMRLPHGRDINELLGSINYLAGAVIALRTWAKKAE